MSLLLEERFVIVLGAGAKPFLPSAPLAEDDYDLKHCSLFGPLPSRCNRRIQTWRIPDPAWSIAINHVLNPRVSVLSALAESAQFLWREFVNRRSLVQFQSPLQYYKRLHGGLASRRSCCSHFAATLTFVESIDHIVLHSIQESCPVGPQCVIYLFSSHPVDVF